MQIAQRSGRHCNFQQNHTTSFDWFKVVGIEQKTETLTNRKTVSLHYLLWRKKRQSTTALMGYVCVKSNLRGRGGISLIQTGSWFQLEDFATLQQMIGYTFVQYWKSMQVKRLPLL